MDARPTSGLGKGHYRTDRLWDWILHCRRALQTGLLQSEGTGRIFLRILGNLLRGFDPSCTHTVL